MLDLVAQEALAANMKETFGVCSFGRGRAGYEPNTPAAVVAGKQAELFLEIGSGNISTEEYKARSAELPNLHKASQQPSAPKCSRGATPM